MSNEFALHITYDSHGGDQLAAVNERLAKVLEKLDAKLEKVAAAASKAEDAQKKLKKGADDGGKSILDWGEKAASAANHVLELAQKAIAGAKALLEFAKGGEQALRVLSRFRGDIEALRANSLNLIDDTTLQQFSNLGDELGLSQQQVERLTLAAAKLYTEGFGESAAKNLEGILAGEAESLRKLGIDVDLSSQKFDGLTEAQKKYAVAADVAAKMAGISADQLDTSNLAASQTQTTIDNFISDLQVMAYELLQGSGAFDFLKEALGQVGDLIKRNRPLIERVSQILMDMMAKAWAQTGAAIETVLNVIAILEPFLPIVTMGVELLTFGLQALNVILGPVAEAVGWLVDQAGKLTEEGGLVGAAWEAASFALMPVPTAIGWVNDAISDTETKAHGAGEGLDYLKQMAERLAPPVEDTSESIKEAEIFMAQLTAETERAAKKIQTAREGFAGAAQSWLGPLEALRSATLGEADAWGNVTKQGALAWLTGDKLEQQAERQTVQLRNVEAAIRDVTEAARQGLIAASPDSWLRAAGLFGESDWLVNAIRAAVPADFGRVEPLIDVQDLVGGIGEDERAREALYELELLLTDTGSRLAEALEPYREAAAEFGDSGLLGILWGVMQPDEAVETLARLSEQLDLVGSQFSAMTGEIDGFEPGLALRQFDAMRGGLRRFGQDLPEISKRLDAFGTANENQIATYGQMATTGVAALGQFAGAFTDDVRFRAGWAAAEQFAAMWASYPDVAGMTAHGIAAAQYTALAAGAFGSGSKSGAGAGAGAASRAGGSGGVSPATFAPTSGDRRRDFDSTEETRILQLMVNDRVMADGVFEGAAKNGRRMRSSSRLDRDMVSRSGGRSLRAG